MTHDIYTPTRPKALREQEAEVGGIPSDREIAGFLSKAGDLEALVRAVNSHAALVEACEEAVPSLAHINGMLAQMGDRAETCAGISALIAKLRAALALAKGGSHA